MALNSSALNSSELNGTGEVLLQGSGPLISLSLSTYQYGSGQLIEVEQNCGPIGSGALIDLNLVTTLQLSGSGPLITIAQETVQTGSGVLISLRLRTRTQISASRVRDLGHELVVHVGGTAVPSGNAEIHHSENEQALATVELINSGSLDYNTYLGLPIYIDVQIPAGLYRLYTGIVDDVQVNIITGKLTLNCIDRRNERLNSEFSLAKLGIGYYSDIIFSSADNDVDEIGYRLSTTTTSLDYDPNGTARITSWFPKVTADFTFDDSEILYEPPKIEIVNRGDIVNSIRTTLEYRYNRYHHMQVDYTWTSPMANNVALLLQKGYSLTYREQVSQAAQQTGWILRGDINYTPIWPTGYYLGILWSTVKYNYTFNVKRDQFSSPVLDDEGNPVLDAYGDPLMERAIIYDDKGNPVLEAVAGSVIDYGPIYCMGATFSLTTRWIQTVTIQHNINVRANGSISQYGLIETKESYSLTDDSSDDTSWEQYTEYTNPYDEDDNSYYVDNRTSIAEYYAAQNAIYYKNRATIIDSHRGTSITWKALLQPTINLTHTVELTSSYIASKGKVRKISHFFDNSTGEAYSEITIAVFKAGILGSDGYSTVGPYVSDIVNYPDNTITLGNHFGQDPTGHPEWTGMIGNLLPYGGLARTNYPEYFVVDTATIPDELRQEKRLQEYTTYTIALTNTTLTINTQ